MDGGCGISLPHHTPHCQVHKYFGVQGGRRGRGGGEVEKQNDAGCCLVQDSEEQARFEPVPVSVTSILLLPADTPAVLGEGPFSGHLAGLSWSGGTGFSSWRKGR